MARQSGKKAAGRTRRTARRSQDALALLREDHAKVDTLLKRFERARGEEQKQSIATTICNELKVHARIEEEIFYPALHGAIEDEDLLHEATVEHQSVKDLVRQIESSSPSEDLYDAKVKVLGEYVKHHVKEEQNEIFKQARRAGLDLAELGERLKARKQELMAEMPERATAAGARRPTRSTSLMDRLAGTA